MERTSLFSIRTKMIAILAASLLLAILSAAYMMRGLLYQNIIDQKMATVDILTASVVHDIKYEYNTRSENIADIKHVIDKFITYYSIIKSISFYNTNHSIIVDSDPENIGKVSDDDEIKHAILLAKPTLMVTQFDRSSLGIRSVFPILRGSKITGAIDMKISIQDIKETMSSIDRKIFIILVSTVLVACGLLYILLRGMILQRLRKLMLMIQRIAAGQYDIKADDSSKDELGRLAQAFDQMAYDLKKSKQEIDDYNKDLEAKVQKATAKLNKAYYNLKNAQSQLVLNEKMASLGLLIAGIAHEINTPVGAMHNIARNLKQKIYILPEALDSFKKDTYLINDHFVDCFNSIIESSCGDQHVPSFREIRRLENLLKEKGVDNYKKITSVFGQLNYMNTDSILQFLDLIKNSSFFALLESLGSISQAIKIFETSSQKIGEIVQALKFYAYTDKDRIEMIQLNESIKTALILLKNKLKHKTNIKTDLDPNLPKILCNIEVHQIWTNLVNNACDAIDEMGEGYAGEIFIRTKKFEDEILVMIVDNGVGIPEEKINKIYDPFFTTKDIGKGTGLGLSIVSGIIKKHNGIITVKSERGNTVFDIRFPLTTEADSKIDSDPSSIPENQAAGISL